MRDFKGLQMRRSPIHGRLIRAGATFETRDSAEMPTFFTDPVAEYMAVRHRAGISDLSSMVSYRADIDTSIYALDEILAGNVASLRYGRVLHTLLADSDGLVKADVYVACNEDDLLVLAETCAETAEIDELIHPGMSGVEATTGNFGIFSIDGPQAWAIPMALFGRDILGIPYLAVEPYDLDGITVRVIRAGKTAEFGYTLVVPAANAEHLFDRIMDAGKSIDAALCGAQAMDMLKLDGRFFNIHAEGRLVRDPLPIGLQWMIDFEKDAFSGRDAIIARRTAGATHKVIGLVLEPGVDGMVVGDSVYCDGELVGQIVNAADSPTMGCRLALALLKCEVAYAGLDFTVVSAQRDLAVRSLSLPPFVQESLKIQLDEV